VSKTLKVNVKYRKAQDGFDFKLSLDTNLKIFCFDKFGVKNNINNVIKLGIVSVIVSLEIIFLGF